MRTLISQQSLTPTPVQLSPTTDRVGQGLDQSGTQSVAFV
jgi:hypothetical protein